MAPRLLIFSFVTRDVPGNPATVQGTELLLYRGPASNFTYTTLYTYSEPEPHKSPLAAALAPKPPTPQLLSQRTVENQTGLPVGDGHVLQLTRRSKRMKWDNDTYLEAFLYHFTPPARPDYHFFNSCLGSRDHHSWLPVGPVIANTESEHVNTALNSVILPPSFCATFDQLLADASSLPEAKFVLLALSLLHQTIRTKAGRQGYRYYPVRLNAPPQRGSKEVMDAWTRQQVLAAKSNIFAYWSNLTWHMRAMHNSTTLNHWLVRCMGSINTLVADPKVDSLEMFEMLAMKAVQLEIERHKSMLSKQTSESVNRLLRIKFHHEGLSVEPEHLCLAIASPASVLRIVTGIIRQILLPDLLSSDLPSFSVKHLHLMLAEGRPALDGVNAAAALHKVIEDCRQQSSRKGGQESDAPSLMVTPHLGGEMIKHTHSQRTYQLLEESLLHSTSRNQVTIELTTDSGMPALIHRNSRDKRSQVVLVGGDSMTPDADVIARSGAFAAISMGRQVEAPCFAVARIESVQLEPNDTLLTQNGDSRSLLPAWFAGDVDNKRELFVRKASSVDQTVLQITCLQYEIVPSDMLDGYLTESGIVDAEAIRAAVAANAEAAKAMWA